MQVTHAVSIAASGLQALVAPAGLAFTEEIVEKTGPRGYLVSGVPGLPFHAGRAVDLLVASAGGKVRGPSLVRPRWSRSKRSESFPSATKASALGSIAS